MRQNITLPDHPAGLPFSDAVLAGDTLYISGRIGIDPKTGLVPDDVDGELVILFDGFERVLAAASMSMSDLVSVTVFCPDLSLFDKFNAAYRAYFQGDFPARAFIGSGPLLRNGRFEMLGIAVKA
jgi:reactive intermediate/imine deaminase